MITPSQKEAVDEQMFLKLRKWRKPELELVTTCNTINKWLSEKYFFDVPFEDMKKIFEEEYVNKGYYTLKESGFLDKKQRYPYYTYKKVRSIKGISPGQGNNENEE